MLKLNRLKFVKIWSDLTIPSIIILFYLRAPLSNSFGHFENLQLSLVIQLGKQQNWAWIEVAICATIETNWFCRLGCMRMRILCSKELMTKQSSTTICPKPTSNCDNKWDWWVYTAIMPLRKHSKSEKSFVLVSQNSRWK